MKYLKKHQVSFNGFAWNHPLRVRWREMGNYDPVMSLHHWQYGWKSVRWYVAAMLSLVLIMSFVISVFVNDPGFLWMGIMVWVVFGLLVLLNLDRKRLKKVGHVFTTAMNELAEMLGITFEQLVRYDAPMLREVALEALRRDAFRTNELRRRMETYPWTFKNFDEEIKFYQGSRAKMKEHYEFFVRHGIFSREKSEADKAYAAAFADILRK